VKKIIAVEEGLLNSIKEILEREGYTVVKPDAGENVDATIISGLDENVMGMQDITVKPAVIEASGKTAEEILGDLKKRVWKY